jgi:hypothetical protein
VLTRLARAWRKLAPEQRLAAFASVLLFVTMFLPWYQLNAVVNDRTGGRLLGNNMTAFGVFSFVEAAVLLVAIAVLVLLFARAEDRAFHLPGGDGTVVMVAGGWVVLLLVWRLFDKPSVSGSGVGNVGIQWGIFFAIAAAGLLTLAGTRMRAAHRPEPAGLPGEDDNGGPAPVDAEQRAARRRRAAAAPGTEVTRPLPPEEAPTEWAEPPARAVRARRQETAERTRRRPVSPPPPPPAPADPPTERHERLPAGEAEPLTERLPDPPTRRLDPPTEWIDDRSARRLDPPTERIDDRAGRRREGPQAESLFDDR